LATFLAQSPQHQSLLTAKYIDLLYKSAPLHDVGKVGIPDSVLLKPGKLTDEEFAIMKGHPQIGADALSIAEKRMGSSSFLRVAKEISLTHHEKWDGSGYPNQLSGEEIPLSGRLMALADVYDALISKRVYKPAFSHEKAREIILEGRGKHFDPQVVDAFLAVEQDFCAIAARYKDGQD
ncbi:HD domain-containing protein, partial [Vibrio navarrensis]|nr:HD domain-containing protein [Vibrio navarrensis]